MDIIAIGELVVDFLSEMNERTYICNPGGAPANLAVAAAKNHTRAGIYCKVGEDYFGDFLLNTLKANGVTPLCEKRCKEAVTTMTFVTLEEGERSFTFARKPGADMFLSPEELDINVLKKAKIIHAGSCALSKGIAKEATVYGLKKAHELGKLTSFDVNYRDLLWDKNENLARERIQEVLPYVNFLKISEEEEVLVGGKENVIEMLEKTTLMLWLKLMEVMEPDTTIEENIKK